MIVGGLTAATLFGSYYVRHQHKKREQAAGENPIRKSKDAHKYDQDTHVHINQTNK